MTDEEDYEMQIRYLEERRRRARGTGIERDVSQQLDRLRDEYARYQRGER